MDFKEGEILDSFKKVPDRKESVTNYYQMLLK